MSTCSCLNMLTKDDGRTSKACFYEPLAKVSYKQNKLEDLIEHYENTPMQYTAIFHVCKNDNFQLKVFDYFHIFAQNIDCGYTLEPPQ